MQQSISIIVTGKVQGVFYRQSTKETALRLNITGEVKNMSDGSVHILATGEKEQLEKLINWCRQGPPKAMVADVQFKDLPLQKFTHFNIVRF